MTREAPDAPLPVGNDGVGSTPVSDAGATGTTGSGGWLVSLRQRLLSAVVLIPIVIALVWFGGWIAFAGAVLALALGMWELRTMFANKGWYPLTFLSFALSLDFLVAAMLPGYRLALVGIGISAFIILSFTWVMVTRPTIERTLIDWALTLAIPFYLGWSMALFLMLRGSTTGYGSPEFWWVLALFFMVWANDTGAYVTGHFFGHNKLAPHISPAKTREGFVGGLLLAVVAAFVFTLPLHIAWYHVVALGILVAIAATVGDLAESLLKRGTGVKDSGTIVPGHGGILDRMDSLLFAVIIVFFYAAFLHGIPLNLN
jgi:phosphatidate cytidylyltransferase